MDAMTATKALDDGKPCKTEILRAA